MTAITSFFLAYLDREEAEQRMNSISDDAIREILDIKPEGGRLPINDDYAIELALIPKYNLKGRKGTAARLWRAWAFILDRLQKQVSEAIANMRRFGEEYAAENESYEPDWTAVLKVIRIASGGEKESKEK